MRILLVAYDFPPIPSPQSLRWAYLVRELANAGHDVHVLAPDVLGYGVAQLPELPASVTVHRCSAGPLTSHLVLRQRQALQRRAQATGDAPSVLLQPPTVHGIQTAPRLNWKGRLFHLANRMLGWLMYPDLRAEWMGPARRALDALLDGIAPDVVITSHEPPVSIPLGLHARRRGVAWIADLGDPVLAPYTPLRWRARAARLERELCRCADLVTVATAGAMATLCARHDLPRERAMVLTQGYDHRFENAGRAASIPFDSDHLELLYTGSFYSFRRPGALLDAVRATPGVRLTIATINPPPMLVELARQQPDSIRLLGFIGHLDALALQRRCDLLVNIANDDPIQVPGKVYEYLGASAPILHVGDHAGDAASIMVAELQAGWSVKASSASITALLRELRDRKRRDGVLARPGDARNRIESAFSWASLAATLDAACRRVVPAR